MQDTNQIFCSASTKAFTWNGREKTVGSGSNAVLMILNISCSTYSEATCDVMFSGGEGAYKMLK